MREVKKRSVVPIYGIAAVWAIYCLIFPLYKFWHFLIPVIASVLAFILLSKLFPGKTEYIKEPEKPFTTGDEKIDALLKEGKMAVSEMNRLKESIKVPSICAKIDELIEITDKIFKDVIDDPGDYSHVRRFANYYLPTTLKLLNAYDRMYSQDIAGENITGTMKRIENILDTTIMAYKKQLDSLFADQALDIETDITVLEGMLKKEGLSGKDF